MTFGYQTFVRVLRFWMVSIRLHKSWSHLEPRFVHGHDFKVNMTVTCQHDECPSARRASLHLIAPFNRFSSWEITPSSSMMQMSEELSELLRKDKYKYISIHKSEGSFSLNVWAFWRRWCTPLYNSSSLFVERCRVICKAMKPGSLEDTSSTNLVKSWILVLMYACLREQCPGKVHRTCNRKRYIYLSCVKDWI